MIRYETWPHVLCLIDALCAHGSWCGASHIQKATCIAQELSAVSVDFDYRYHPYCFELREEKELPGASLEVQVDRWAGYQPDISLEAARQSLTIAKTWRKEWAQQTDRAPMSSVSSPKAR